MNRLILFVCGLIVIAIIAASARTIDNVARLFAKNATTAGAQP